MLPLLLPDKKNNLWFFVPDEHGHAKAFPYPNRDTLTQESLKSQNTFGELSGEIYTFEKEKDNGQTH